MSEEFELGDLSGLADGELRCFQHVGRDGIRVADHDDPEQEPADRLALDVVRRQLGRTPTAPGR